MNNVNITNTNVNITRVTNMYNAVIVNRSTTINNITYANQHINNGVTVVSRDTFVNARPVASNVMRVDQRELASAPVTHIVAAEPNRASVVGAGRPVSVRPPAAVLSRPVVAVRTPAPPQRPIAERQAQAGGHLSQQVLVHPMLPQPAVNQSGRRQPSQDGFRPFSGSNANSSNNNNPQVRQMPQTQPRTYEQQGSSEPDSRNLQPQENRNSQPANRAFRPPQAEQSRPVIQETHPLVRPVAPVQERSPQQEEQQQEKFNQWHEQRPASPPPAKPAPRAPAPAPEPKPAKKGN